MASFIGVLVVHSREDQDPMDALNRGYYVTTLLALAGFAVAVYYMLQGRWWLLGCGVVGMVTSFLFVRITEYYTETRYRPVQSIANASLTGPATNIISGLAVGMETPAMPVVVISAALLLSYYFGVRGLADAHDLRLRQGHLRHRHCDHGHAVLRRLHPGHGYVWPHYRQCRRNHRNVGSARLGARKDRQAGRGRQHHQGADQGLRHWLRRPGCVSALFRLPGDGPRHRGATLRRCAARCSPANWSFTNINLASVPVFVGALLGAMLIFLFSSFAIKAVGRTAQYIIEDVRAQFRENPGIMAGTSKPDYGRCVRIVTGAALKQMVLPGALAVLTPLAVGLVFRNLSGSFHIHIPGEYTPDP